MAWYFVFLNLFFAAIVVGVIVGLHGWAIASPHHGSFDSRRELAAPEATPAPMAATQFAARAAVG